MSVRSVWHAGFSVRDVDASIAFWTEALGLVLRHRQIQENEYTSFLVGYPDVRLSVAQLMLPEGGYGPSGHIIELIEYQRPVGEELEPENSRIGSSHIALEVDDIDATRDRCERMGAVFLSHTLDIAAGINRGGRAVYARAPDGITFELIQPPSRARHAVDVRVVSMKSDAIKVAIDGAVDYLRAHPGEARSTDSLATARMVNGLVVQVTGREGESLTTDMVRSVGGTASAPSPGWLLRAAEASCVATLIAMRAAQVGVALDELEVDVDSESDDRGILGVEDSVRAGPLSGRVVVRITAAGVPGETLREVAEWGIAHCPVYDAVENGVPIAKEILIG